jgi:glyoxylase-like metal-dependent hydrolase (beta-lactamase superfamily II)
MRQLREDLWQTTVSTFEGADNASYLLRRPEGNVLFYNTMTEDDLVRIAALGGVAHHVLSHRHEADQGPWALVKQKFGSRLCTDALEAAALGEGFEADIVFGPSGGRLGDVEVLHTPGHTTGGISCVYRSPDGETYLFSGDTILPANGQWIAPPVHADGGDDTTLAASLSLLRDLKPDLVLSSTSVGELTVEVGHAEWLEAVDANVSRLSH